MATDNSDSTQDALFREVDEDLRQEQVEKLWKKYQNVIIGVAVAIVMIVGGREGWRVWEANHRANDALRYGDAVALIEAGKASAAAEALQSLAAESRTAYRVIAAMRKADLLAATGDTAAAVAAYRAVADDGGADKAYRDAATVLAALHGIDRTDPRVLETALTPLTGPDSPWRHTALELSAVAARRTGDEARARDILTRLADDPQTPSGIRGRAAELLSQTAPAPLAKG